MKCTVIRIIKYEGNEVDIRNAMRLSKTLGEHDYNGYTMTIAEHYSDLPQLIKLPDADVDKALEPK
jgi:hypothetical protein